MPANQPSGPARRGGGGSVGEAFRAEPEDGRVGLAKTAPGAAEGQFPGDARGLPAHVPLRARLANGSVQGMNSFGKTGYGGPCPPKGTHHYRFTLLALSAPLELRTGTTASAVRAAAKGRTLATITLDATYRRG